MKLLDRGVYLIPCYDEAGYRYLVAVDSRHRVIRRQRLFSTDEVPDQTAMLARMLDREDPVKKVSA